MTSERCGDCNGKVKNYVYELQKDKAPLVCESCFENYLEKWGVERKRWEQVKEFLSNKTPAGRPARPSKSSLETDFL